VSGHRPVSGVVQFSVVFSLTFENVCQAKDIISKGLAVKEFELKRKNFSQNGNWGFGISEHIDLGIKYDPNAGIYGMDFYVVMKRAGVRVGRRKLRKNRVGFRQRLTKQDAITWFEKEWTEDFAKVLN